MGADVPRIEGDRAPELFDRVVQLALVLVEQAEVVVDFGALVVLFEQRAMLRHRVVVSPIR